MEHGKKERMGMMYGSMPNTRTKANKGIYADDKKRMPKNMGGVANAQPTYSEDMPKAMPN